MTSKIRAELAEELRAYEVTIKQRDTKIEYWKKRTQNLETENSNLKYERKHLEETVALLEQQIEVFQHQGQHSRVARSSRDSDSASSEDVVRKKESKQDASDVDTASEKTLTTSEVVNALGFPHSSPYPFPCEVLDAAEQRHALESIVPTARPYFHLRDLESVSLPESQDADFQAIEKMAIREDQENGADEHNFDTFQDTGEELALQPRPFGRFPGSEFNEVGTSSLQQPSLPFDGCLSKAAQLPQSISGLSQQPPHDLSPTRFPAIYIDPSPATQRGFEGQMLHMSVPDMWPHEIESVEELAHEFPHLARRLCVFIFKLPPEQCKSTGCAHKYVEGKAGVTLAAASLSSVKPNRRICNLTVGCRSEQDANLVREQFPQSNLWVPSKAHKAAAAMVKLGNSSESSHKEVWEAYCVLQKDMGSFFCDKYDPKRHTPRSLSSFMNQPNLTYPASHCSSRSKGVRKQDSAQDSRGPCRSWVNTNACRRSWRRKLGCRRQLIATGRD